MARPRAALPDEEIAWRGRQGQGAPAIRAAFTARGVSVAESTVSARLAELRAKGWPGADTYAASLPKAPARRAVSPANEAGDVEGLSEEDLIHLPGELLAEASTATKQAFLDALASREPVAADKYAAILERFTARLVAARPPEKVEPVKDPTNISARREILERWDRLREPYEVSGPVVDQMQAHVDALRSRAEKPTAA